ncbi:hypothetical protein ACMD2_12309 [Ananas comosus]|uniref:Uncharacterized protein n=1 Tax=Ananas comosus TaxID=4615 RepID=A0A199W797_ANACO|nr:hypothetical protein ACMD2_12309 [Ananas comosus]
MSCDLPIRRLHPPGRRYTPVRASHELPIRPLELRNHRGRKIGRFVFDQIPHRIRALAIQPKMQIGIHIPNVQSVCNPEPEFVRLSIQDLAEKRGDLDIIGWQIERADPRNGPPQKGIDPSGVDHAIGRIGIPEFVVLVEGDVDFDDGAVGVPWDREVLRLDVGGILDREPQPVVERQIPRDREDEVGGGDGEGLGGGEEGGVLGDVLPDGPEDAGGAGLGGAAAEELDAAEPDAEDAVELAPAARRRPLEHGADGGAAAEVAAEAARGSVGGGGGGLGVGGGEVVLEEEEGA